jgi:hypothetical protein
LSRFGECVTEVGGTDEENIHPTGSVAVALAGGIEAFLEHLSVVGERHAMAESERLKPERERAAEGLRGEGRAETKVVL